MDGDSHMLAAGDGQGKYRVELGDKKRVFEFNNAQLALPAGVMADNYY